MRILASIGKALVIFALFLLGCGPARPLVPLTPRPDTRHLVRIVFDTAAMESAVRIFGAAYPHEAAVCLYGELRDTLSWQQVARIHRVRQAKADSAGNFFVWFPRLPLSGCDGDGLIGHAHSHPHSVGLIPCIQSPDDANLVFVDRRLLFSIIFCADGRRQVLYQDGRRYDDWWVTP